jgi:hypothetical protein
LRSPSGKSSDQAGELLNVSARSVQSARKVRRHRAPELIAAVEAGDISVSTAAKLTELPKDQQADIAEQSRRKAGDRRKRKTATQAAKEMNVRRNDSGLPAAAEPPSATAEA